MGRSSLAVLLLLALVLVLPAAPVAQTKDDTVVHALQSDVDSWDPPNSVLREAIILGYHGLVDTPLTAGVAPDVRDEIIRAVPLGRAGRPEEIAAVVGFLCSDRAGYVTGQVISVDRGLT